MATQNVSPKLKNLAYELKEVDWKELGVQLDVPGHILRNIDRENPGNESRKLLEVLQYWINNEEPVASWKKILEALQRIGGHANIITNIESKYIVRQPSHQITSYPVMSTLSVAEKDVCYVIDGVLSLVNQLVRFPAELRDVPCADDCLVELSKYIVGRDEWKELAPFLCLSPEEVEEINKTFPKVSRFSKATAQVETSPEIKMLRRWRGKFGKKASYRFLITAFHEANKMELIKKLQLIAIQFPKFPAGLLDIPCAKIILDKFNDSLVDMEEVSRVVPESDQERELLRAFSLHTQCVEALRIWRKDCKDKANYRCLITFLDKAQRVDLIDKLQCIVSLKWYGGYLKKQYKNVFFCSRASADRWLPSLTQKIFNLAIIKKEKIQRGKIDNKFVLKTIRGQVDDILLEKSPIELRYIFRNIEGERKVILIDGAPGSGKSTLTIHISQQWGRGELFNEFTVVILVQLRDPEVQNAKLIAELLPCENRSMAEQAEREIMAVRGSGVLWVLDGWDELPLDLQKESIISKLIKPKLHQENPLSKTAVIVTSRPVSSGDLCPLVSSRIEVLGFTAEEQRLFFIECLNNDTKAVETLMESLSSNPAMEGSCYLPLNASIIAHLYLTNGSLPTTIYGIFSSLVQHCLSRYRHERQGISQMLASFESLDELPDDLRSSFEQLCKLAFTGTKDNKVTFSSSDIEALGCSDEICELGLLQAVPSIVAHGRSVYYNFLHLSIQEMLAAVHISRMPAGEQISTFDSMFNEARFSAVLQFYAAITKLRTSRPLLSRVPHYLRPVPASIYDLVRKMIQKGSQTVLVSLLNCLYEAQDTALCVYVAEQLRDNVPLLEKITGFGFELDLKSVSLLSQERLSIGYFLASIAVSYKGKLALNLDSCSLGDTGIKILMSLDPHSEITGHFDMSIDYNGITGEGASYIAEALRSTTVLRKLSLCGNPIGDKGLQYITEALTTNTSLVELNLGNCSLRISGKNGATLTEMLQRNKTLRKINLSNNEAILFYLCEAAFISEGLKKNTTLKTLNLTGCQSIPDNGIELIRSNATTCKIISDID